MVSAWRDEEGARAFLAAVEERTPPELRSKSVTAWISRAKGRADALDPLSKVRADPEASRARRGRADDEFEDGPEVEPARALRQPIGVGADGRTVLLRSAPGGAEPRPSDCPVMHEPETRA